FYPAANNGSFTLMLSGRFIVGLGFRLQQISANPPAIGMGNPATGAQRLNRAGGVHGFGPTSSTYPSHVPYFRRPGARGIDASIGSVKIPYLVLGAAFVLVAVFLKFSSVPNQIDLEALAADEVSDADKRPRKPSAFAYPQLALGMIAIFVYVGVEVSTISNL